MRTRRALSLLAPFVLATPAAAAARDLPPRWDWRELGMVTPARNFGFCDATWCFAAVAAVESMLLIHEGRALDLSEQQVLACATPGRGCGGGWMDEAYRVIRDHGIAEEACFPYTGDENLACDAFACAPAATIADWVDVPDDVSSLKSAVLAGPVTTVMRAPWALPGYDGSYCIPASAPASADYLAVLIVGWDDALCGTGGWICKNSFGAGWGDAGCFTVEYGAFGIGEHAQRPLPADGQRLRGVLAGLVDGTGGGTGDGDSWPEPGETPVLALEARNGPLAPARTGGAARLTVIAGPASSAAGELILDPVNPGGRSELRPLVPLAVDRTAAPGDTIRLRLAFSVAGAPAGDDTLSLVIGEPYALVVGDDEGERLEQWAAESARRVGYPVRVWQENRQGPVSARELARYRAVVWNEGVYGRLGTDNIYALAGYLDGGGRLFISGQDIGWWLMEFGGSALERTFFEHYLQATYLADDAAASSVEGDAGDHVGDGLAFGIGGPGGSGRQASPDLIAPQPTAWECFAYGPGRTAGVRSEARGRLLYCAFGFEAIDQQAARDSVMSRTLAWLAGPRPDLSPPRVEVLSPHGGETFATGSALQVRWRAGDDRGVVACTVERSSDGGATWPERLGWFAPGDSEFTWTVGGATGDGQRLRVSATDAAGLWGAAVSGAFRIGEPSAAWTGALTAQPSGAGALVELATNLDDPSVLAIERRAGAGGAGPARRWTAAGFTGVTRGPDGLRATILDDDDVGWPRTYALLALAGGTERVLDRIVSDGAPPAALGVDAWPNPFNPRLAVRVALPRAGRVTVAVYDARGRLVRTLATGAFPAGRRLLAWDGTDDAGRPAASGAYELRVRDERALQTRRVTLLR